MMHWGKWQCCHCCTNKWNKMKNIKLKVECRIITQEAELSIRKCHQRFGVKVDKLVSVRFVQAADVVIQAVAAVNVEEQYLSDTVCLSFLVKLSHLSSATSVCCVWCTKLKMTFLMWHFHYLAWYVTQIYHRCFFIQFSLLIDML